MSYPAEKLYTWPGEATLRATNVVTGLNDSFDKVYDDLIPANIDNVAGSYTDVTAVGTQPTELGTELKQLRSQVKTLATQVLGTTNWNEDFTAKNDGDIQTAIGLVIGTNVQAWSARLDEVAGLTPTNSNIIVGNGSSWIAESGATARTSLGLVIGTDVAAVGVNSDITSLAALTTINPPGSGAAGLLIQTDPTITLLDLRVDTDTQTQVQGINIAPNVNNGETLTVFVGIEFVDNIGSGTLTDAGTYAFEFGSAYHSGAPTATSSVYLDVSVQGVAYRIKMDSVA